MKKILKSLYHLFLPLILGSLVGLLISSSIDYTELVKPPLAPPKIFFPIAWTIIYLLMGISWFIINKKNLADSDDALVYYGQLFINLLWSIIFFLFKWRFVAVIWIILLDVVVYYMLYLFSKKNKLAVYLNIFYALWITFATYLTIGIYMLN